jgi:protein lin-28
MPKRCHNCKAEDHLIGDCPTLPKENPKPENTEKSLKPENPEKSQKNENSEKNRNNRQRPKRTNVVKPEKI